MKLEVFKNNKGQWYWHAVATNGRIVADGGEGYTRKENLLDELNKIKTQIGSAPIVEI
jgi:uncharacterized protein YegP (UPF0339 family)